MVSLSPTALDAFLSAENDGPVVMLNLLRFQPDGGRERYLRYLELAGLILGRLGASIVFGGDGLPVLTAGGHAGWDAAVLVQYPRRSVFKALVDDPEYQSVFPIGVSALADLLLQPLTPMVGAASRDDR